MSPSARAVRVLRSRCGFFASRRLISAFAAAVRRPTLFVAAPFIEPE